MIPGTTASQLLLFQEQGGISFADVSLLTSWDGVDDDSNYGHVATFQGAAQIDTAQSKFGGAAVLFGGVGDRVRWANHVSFLLGTSPFCFETFARFSNVSGSSRQIAGVWDTFGGTPEKSWRLRYSTSLGGLAFNYSANGSTESDVVVIAPGGGFLVNTWYHLCYERDAFNTLRGYVDGLMIDKLVDFTANIFASAKDLTFGQNPDGTAQFLGWQDESRLIVGDAPYANDVGFEVTTAPYPRS